MTPILYYSPIRRLAKNLKIAKREYITLKNCIGSRDEDAKSTEDEYWYIIKR